MNTTTILINGIHTPVHVQVKRKKNSSARLKSDGLYIYLSHLDARREQTISHFIAWAESRQVSIMERISLIAQITSKGSVVTCYGERYRIERQRAERKSVGAKIIDDSIIVEVGSGDIDDKQIAKAALRALQKKHEPQVISELFALQEQYFPGIRLVKGGMRYLTSRWGSYSGRGEVKLSTALLVMPRQYLMYVMVHELAHGMYMNHSHEFWKEVERVLPEYREVRKGLKKYEI